MGRFYVTTCSQELLVDNFLFLVASYSRKISQKYSPQERINYKNAPEEEERVTSQRSYPVENTVYQLYIL